MGDPNFPITQRAAAAQGGSVSIRPAFLQFVAARMSMDTFVSGNYSASTTASKGASMKSGTIRPAAMQKANFTDDNVKVVSTGRISKRGAKLDGLGVTLVTYR